MKWIVALIPGLAITLLLGAPARGAAPRFEQTHLRHIGAFRVPGGTFGASTFGYSESLIAFNPQHHSLFFVGHSHQQHIAEIDIPTPSTSQHLNDLPIANVRQPFTSIINRLPNYALEGAVKIGGILVINNQLYGTIYEFYDANNQAAHSHFKLSSLNLQSATVSGLFRVGSQLNPGYVAGYMAEIPLPWQDDFGHSHLTGQAALSIISRTSAGPAALAFDPQQLGHTPAPVTPMVYYPLANRLAPETSQNPLFNLATTITGVLFPRGFRSVIFFGAHGIGPYCYGEAAPCGDPVRHVKGTHAYPYRYYAWAYDVEDLLLVKNGQLQPWQVQPYGVWTLTFPFSDTTDDKHIGGIAYDAQHARMYLTQSSADRQGEPKPIIHVFDVSPPGTADNMPPDKPHGLTVTQEAN